MSLEDKIEKRKDFDLASTLGVIIGIGAIGACTYFGFKYLYNSGVFQKILQEIMNYFTKMY